MDDEERLGIVVEEFANVVEVNTAVLNAQNEKILQLEAQVARLREALEGAMQNTILLIEYAEPVYTNHAKYGLTAIARVLDETAPMPKIT